MTGLAAALSEQARELSALEVVAVVTAVGYLFLAIRQNIWCWACAAVSTAIYIYLFIGAGLYMESILNVFYLAMAAYGWYSWYFGRFDGHEKSVVRWPISHHAVAILVLFSIAVMNGFLLERHTAAVFPYIDSATTWGAIWATYLVARKVLENWWYWLLIDAVSVVIYWLRDLELTAILFIAYLFMIPFGYLSWRRSMRVEQSELPS